MPVSYTESVTAEIRAHMARQRLTQTSLAELLSWTQQYLSRRLTGQVAWSTEDLADVARALSVPIHELVSPRAS